MNLATYNAFFKQVIDFNKTIGFNKKNVEDPQAIALYKKLTDDELQETWDAVQAEDNVEIKDGIFDVFVTGSFLNYLHTGFSETIYPMRKLPEKSRSSLENQITDIGAYVVDGYPAHIDILKLISIGEQYFTFEEMHQVFVDGIASNNSKFIFDLSKSNLEKQLAFAEQKYDGQYQNLKLVKGKYGDKQRVVYLIRADYGEGKLLKPESFQDLVIRPQPDIKL